MKNIKNQLEIVNKDSLYVRDDERFKFDFQDFPLREYVTYERMCALLGVSPVKGQAKKDLIACLKLKCILTIKTLRCNTQRYAITCILNEPRKLRVDLKGLKTSQFKVDKEDEDKHGIYAIVKGQSLYLGYTYERSFRDEFIHLAQNTNRLWDKKHKGYGLTLGGDFIILETLEDNIGNFKYEGKQEMFNRIKNNVSVNTEYVIMNIGRTNYHTSYRNLRIPTNTYKKCIDLLIENELI